MKLSRKENLIYGDDIEIRGKVEILNNDTPLDGATAWITIKESLDDTDENALLQLNSEDNPENFIISDDGSYTIWILTSNYVEIATPLIQPSEYYYVDIQFQLSSGRKKTHVSDIITFKPQVTRS